MQIDISFYHVISLAAMLLTGAWGLVLVIIRQFDARLTDKFSALDHSRAEDKKIWEERYNKQEAALRHVDREVTDLKAELPERYWRREDAIRETATIHAKVDGLAAKIEMLIMQTARSNRND
ncbi:MAG: hypothetical protein JNM52_11065 [Betaproteobacteria bacterium]|nr:hypothetical protein [Betaproteobacteria bacterium]